MNMGTLYGMKWRLATARTLIEEATAQAADAIEQAKTPAKSGTVEPTWTSADGTTHKLCDMPTGYLRNVLAGLRRNGLDYGPHFCGLYHAIQDELAGRDDRDGSTHPVDWGFRRKAARK